MSGRRSLQWPRMPDDPSVEIFAAGERVPDWLMRVEPLSSESSVNFFVFFQRAVVIEARDRRIVVGLDDPVSPVIHFCGDRCHISAEEKPAWIATAFDAHAPVRAGGEV